MEETAAAGNVLVEGAVVGAEAYAGGQFTVD